MRNERGSNQYQIKYRGLRLKTWFSIALIFLLTILGLVGIQLINNWFNHNYFVFNQPVKISFLPPVEIKIRKPQVIVKKLILDFPDEIDTPIEKYICDKFGVYDCKTALAVSQAENGTRQPDRFHINTNGTLDIGIFQINSVHFNKSGCSLAELVDVEKNVDCAYSIWKAQGWTPWVSWQNGSYLK